MDIKSKFDLPSTNAFNLAYLNLFYKISDFSNLKAFAQDYFNTTQMDASSYLCKK